MSENKNIYVWNAKEKVFQDWSSLINLSFKFSDLWRYVNDKWYVNLSLSKRKSVWRYWETHTMKVNTYWLNLSDAPDETVQADDLTDF